MSEISIAALDPAFQKQVESARAALDRGRPAQALELCINVLDAQPSCLAVRKIERAAQLKIAATKKSLVSKLMTAVSTAPFLLGGNFRLKDDPRGALTTADRLLRRDPQNVAALCLLGQAAAALGWTETSIFAYEGASDLEPERLDLWIFLAGAYLAGGRATDAVVAAQQALELNPASAEAQAVLRDASVAETVAKGKWESSGDFREKLHDGPKTG